MNPSKRGRAPLQNVVAGYPMHTDRSCGHRWTYLAINDREYVYISGFGVFHEMSCSLRHSEPRGSYSGDKAGG